MTLDSLRERRGSKTIAKFCKFRHGGICSDGYRDWYEIQFRVASALGHDTLR